MIKKLFAALLAGAILLTACQAKTPPPTGKIDCKISSIFPAPVEPKSIGLEPASASDWSRGPEDAKMTIILYSDFQCPGCQGAAMELKALQEQYPADVRLIFRHFPLSMHDKASLAAQAAEAAGIQGKFWEMHDTLFKTDNWEFWTPLAMDDFKTWIGAQALALGMDDKKFLADMTAPAQVNKIQKSIATGFEMKLDFTPSIFIFGHNDLLFKPKDGLPFDVLTLSTILKLEDMRSRQFMECPNMVIDPSKEWQATIKTAKGDIVIGLLPKYAPLAVNNFAYLAQNGWYKGVTFHRVIPDFVAQAGDPSGTGMGGPGYAFNDEINPALVFDKPGVLAMANSGPNSNGSQFFITYKEHPELNGKYTIFGQVLKGMDVLTQLTVRDPQTGGDLPPGDEIIDIVIEEK
ncbi:MAG TPA: peptidylprolyl isomerase [Bellilinea sp.]|nr:peptidylprolyl isomerase [Bellilinea sp.]